MISAHGKQMRINFQVDWYRQPPPTSRQLAYPANLHFDWRRWIEEGLCDEGVLRFFDLPFDCIFNDEIAQQVIASCRQHNIPICVNEYIKNLDSETLQAEYRSVLEDEFFCNLRHTRQGR